MYLCALYLILDARMSVAKTQDFQRKGKSELILKRKKISRYQKIQSRISKDKKRHKQRRGRVIRNMFYFASLKSPICITFQSMKISLFYCHHTFTSPSCSICPVLAYIPRNSCNTNIPKAMMNFPSLEQFSKLEAFQLALNLLLSCLLAAFGFNLSNLADSYRAGRQIL